jgi:tetratricopeptide (TPR) repeat protein
MAVALELATEIMEQCRIEESDPVKLAITIKNEANKCFKGMWILSYDFIFQFLDENYDLAIELYTKCIELDPSEPIYFGNRSMSYLKKELFGLALDVSFQC